MLPALEKHPPTRRYLVGVSGGRDSVVLLHALHERGYRKLIVCHVNHLLRGRASTRDAAFVKRLTARLGYECEILKANVATLAKEQRQSVETMAREVRLDFFAAMARKHRCPRVMLAHHAEDQAETVLMRVLRGTGIGGLAGMVAEQGMQVGKTTLALLRPLLHVRRAEIDAYLAAHRLAYCEDASNADTRLTRNGLRHELIPLASEAMGREVTPILVRLSRLAAREDDLLAHLASALLAGTVEKQGALRLSPSLMLAHSALQHRVVQKWLGQQQVPGISQEMVEDAVKLMLSRTEPARFNLPTGLQLRRKAGRLCVVRQ